jgi:hypothetical protein
MAVTSKANSNSRNNKENIAMNNNKTIVVREKENNAKKENVKRPVVTKKPVHMAATAKTGAPINKATNKAAFVMISNEDETKKNEAENLNNDKKKNILRKSKSVNELPDKTVRRPALDKQVSFADLFMGFPIKFSSP